MKIIDLIGQKFGRWIVLKFDKKYKGKLFWICECQCDKKIIKSVRGDVLKRKMSQSCGCLGEEIGFNSRGKNSRTWKGYEDIGKSYFCMVKHGALKRNLEFSITIEDMWELFLRQDKKCALSGLELKFYAAHRHLDGNASLDRIRNKEGYTLNNIQWVDKNINMMKLWHSDEDFIKYCTLVVNHNKKKEKS